MATDTKTAADVERLQKALAGERDMHAKTRRILREHLGEILMRIDAIEHRQDAGISMAAVTSGLAEIRSDLRAELATMRGEIAEVAETVAQFVRG